MQPLHSAAFQLRDSSPAGSVSTKANKTKNWWFSLILLYSPEKNKKKQNTHVYMCTNNVFVMRCHSGVLVLHPGINKIMRIKAFTHLFLNYM